MPRGRKYSVSLRCFRIGPAVGREGIAETTQRFLECDVRKNSVRTDAHDLGVQAGKLGEVRLDCRQFVLSNRSEVERVEKDDDVFSFVAR